MENIRDYIDECLSNYRIGSKDFCRTARMLTIVNEWDDLKLPKDIFDKFITDKPIEGIGDYLIFITYYIKTIGYSTEIVEILDLFVQNYLFNLNTLEKKYIEDELLELKNRNICPRLVNKMLAQIRGEKELYGIYLYDTRTEVNKYFKMQSNNIKKYKYYPF